jgi:hypothetical protein
VNDGTTKPKPVLAVCMPMARGIHPATNRCLLAGIPRPYHLFDPVGFQVDVARNMITSEACQYRDVTHLMWIDDDMTFAPDAVQRLVDRDLPIVGGLCHNRRHPYMPILVKETQRGCSFMYDYPEGLVEVDATGAAFLLVKKEVFFKMYETTGEGWWTPKGVSEDISFCRRARQAGYKVFVDTRVKIGHMGEVEVEETFARHNRQFQVNPWYPKRPMPAGSPVASIVIPTWNTKPEWLRAAVESALEQTVPVEVIVVDDGSDVPVRRDLAIDAPFKLIRIPHGGCFAALNAGIRAMTTEWFCWLSADDILYPPKVERQLRAMDDKSILPRPLASFHGYDILKDGILSTMVAAPFQWKTIEEQRRVLTKGCAINGLTAMIHKSILGEFDETYTIASDWAKWCEIAAKTYWLPINDVLATRRESGENASVRYAQDPAKRAIWAAEDAKIRETWGTP